MFSPELKIMLRQGSKEDREASRAHEVFQEKQQSQVEAVRKVDDQCGIDTHGLAGPPKLRFFQPFSSMRRKNRGLLQIIVMLHDHRVLSQTD